MVPKLGLVLGMALSALVVPGYAVATTEEACRKIVDAELAADWRPPNRDRPERAEPSIEFDLPHIFLRYRFPLDEAGGADRYSVLMNHRFTLYFETKEEVLAAREKLGQMVTELTGLLRAHTVVEHCGLASGEALRWRAQGLLREILRPTPLIQVLGGGSTKWVKGG